MSFSSQVCQNVGCFEGLDNVGFASIKRIWQTMNAAKSPTKNGYQPKNNAHTYEFHEFIYKETNQNKQEFIKNQNFEICINQTFVSIFKKSDSISAIKRKSHFRMPKLNKDKINRRF